MYVRALSLAARLGKVAVPFLVPGGGSAEHEVVLRSHTCQDAGHTPRASDNLKLVLQQATGAQVPAKLTWA